MIGSVDAGAVVNGNGEMFIFALVVDDDASRRFTVAETERIWPKPTTMLSVGLPTIAPCRRSQYICTTLSVSEM